MNSACTSEDECFSTIIHVEDSTTTVGWLVRERNTGYSHHRCERLIRPYAGSYCLCCPAADVDCCHGKSHPTPCLTSTFLSNIAANGESHGPTMKLIIPGELLKYTGATVLVLQ